MERYGKGKLKGVNISSVSYPKYLIVLHLGRIRVLIRVIFSLIKLILNKTNLN
jgi:hypothetical protein